MTLPGDPPGPNDPPRPTGRYSELDLRGYVLPWFEGQPSRIGLTGMGDALPIFSTQAAFERAIDEGMPIPYEKLKQIDDGPEFLSSVPGWLPVVVDLHYSERGTVLFKEIKRT
jgi:hypothetical protein